ncbi:MAG: hypothetical protein WC838_01385, partial [Candidatus Margulisiibacteriota bacterium]
MSNKKIIPFKPNHSFRTPFCDPNLAGKDKFGIALNNLLNPVSCSPESQQLKDAAFKLIPLVQKVVDRFYEHSIETAYCILGSAIKGNAAAGSDLDLSLLLFDDLRENILPQERLYSGHPARWPDGLKQKLYALTEYFKRKKNFHLDIFLFGY